MNLFIERDDGIGKLIFSLELFERSFNVADELLILFLFGLRGVSLAFSRSFRLVRLFSKDRFVRNIIETGFTAYESKIESACIHPFRRSVKDDGILDDRGIGEVYPCMASYDDLNAGHGLGHFRILGIAEMAQKDDQVGIRFKFFDDPLGRFNRILNRQSPSASDLADPKRNRGRSG